MKTPMKIFFLLAVIGFVAGCSKTIEFLPEDSGSLKKAHVKKEKKSHGLDQDRYVMMKDQNLMVHYRIIGKGPIDVVLIPGWTNPLTVYTKQFDYFRDKARCIYIDLPGTGLSDAPTPNTPAAPIVDGYEYTMELMADAVYTVIKKEGLKKFVGVGFSMGPRVLGMFERNYPGMMSKLVTIDGGFEPWPTEEPARSEYIANREGTYLWMLTWDEAFKAIVGGTLIPPDLAGPDAEELREWGTYFPQFPSDILANTNYHAGAENANEPVGWEYPILCFYQNEPNMDKVNWIYPDNTVHVFPGGGHVIHWIFHEDINPLIWEFIKDRPGKKYGPGKIH